MNQNTQIEKTADLSVYEGKTFESLYKIAEVLADTSLIPESLKVLNEPQKTVANCFLVTEQAHRWGMSPFAVMGSASVIHGKLMWEGKLVHAVVEQQLGTRLQYEFNNEQREKLGVVVSGTLPGEAEPRSIDGTVDQWKTTGNGSPWKMSDESALKRQLRYRGAREWARAHSPGAILGILAKDEALDFDAIKPAVVVRDNPTDPFGGIAALPEPAKSDLPDRKLLLEKIETAWKALKKTPEDKLKAFEFFGKPNCMEFEELDAETLRKLLKTLQGQMNDASGKTKGELEAEKAAKKAKREGIV